MGVVKRGEGLLDQSCVAEKASPCLAILNAAVPLLRPPMIMVWPSRTGVRLLPPSAAKGVCQRSLPSAAFRPRRVLLVRVTSWLTPPSVTRMGEEEVVPSVSDFQVHLESPVARSKAKTALVFLAPTLT